MASQPVRQGSFAGGEFDPLLYGRTDHPRYPSGMRKCLNFIIGKKGAITNRSGTNLVAKVMESCVSPILNALVCINYSFPMDLVHLCYCILVYDCTVLLP